MRGGGGVELKKIFWKPIFSFYKAIKVAAGLNKDAVGFYLVHNPFRIATPKPVIRSRITLVGNSLKFSFPKNFSETEKTFYKSIGIR